VPSECFVVPLFYGLFEEKNLPVNPFSIVSTAPGRCGIVGNPTDMYGGSVLSCTTRERAQCTLVPHDALVVQAGDDSQVLHTAEDFLPTGNRLDLAKAVLRGLSVHPAKHHFHLKSETDIPMQAGLSGSTALVGAVYGAVAAYLELQQNKYVIAEEIRRIEYEIMGVVCGFQDQHMAVFGGLNYMDFRDKGSHLPMGNQPLATVEPLADVTLPGFVLANTGVKHHSGTVHKSVRQRWLDGETMVVEAYDRVRHLAQIGKRALLAGDWQTLADAMNENQQIQHDLGASGKACDDLAAAARGAGAMAAKLAGAGHGGTVLALVTEDTHDAVVVALKNAGASRILYPEPAPGLQVTRTS